MGYQDENWPEVSSPWLAPKAIVDTATETHRRLGETPVSRIWNALKEAERGRAHVTQRNGIASPDEPCEKPSERDSIERREGQRPAHRVPLLVYGWDAEEQPFHEEAEAFEINENGSLLWLETRVARGQRLFLANTRNQAEQECCVITIGKRIHGKARVAIQFSRPAPHFWREA
jgi:hypothetical protein